MKPLDPLTGQPAEFKKVREGTVNDTITCVTQTSEGQSVERCYISAIDVVAKHFPFDNSQTPLSTAVFSWARTLAAGEEGTDDAVPAEIEITEKVCSGANQWNEAAEKKCGEGIPFADYAVRRTKSSGEILFPPDGTSLLFSFSGNSSHFVRHPNGEVKTIRNTFAGELNTDHSGKADIDAEDGKVKVHFDLLAFRDSTTGEENENAATGTMVITLTEPDGTTSEKTVEFTISRFGHVTVTFPDGKEERFPV